jgi:hypothetical protein
LAQRQALLDAVKAVFEVPDLRAGGSDLKIEAFFVGLTVGEFEAENPFICRALSDIWGQRLLLGSRFPRNAPTWREKW